ncbi:hypothetical protein Pyn_31063 [Prunus yedoensis var. nudiflora]|uniref:Uncharacterized protein n=1 Tax=Prunus yedoensis var. nudiflora TaxID=2094558 RepID=A0A314ZDW1_PRUYE|nr:hypothetical protein Pyn_31063 [Prunus yedoensis var. nudiflora]
MSALNLESECKEIHDSWGQLNQLALALASRTGLKGNRLEKLTRQFMERTWQTDSKRQIKWLTTENRQLLVLGFHQREMTANGVPHLKEPPHYAHGVKRELESFSRSWLSMRRPQQDIKAFMKIKSYTHKPLQEPTTLTARPGRLNGKLRFLTKEFPPIANDGVSKCTDRRSEAVEMRRLGLSVCCSEATLKWDLANCGSYNRKRQRFETQMNRSRF